MLLHDSLEFVDAREGEERGNTCKIKEIYFNIISYASLFLCSGVALAISIIQDHTKVC
jgi:hypothetical protein